jgi:hypothetical protein
MTPEVRKLPHALVTTRVAPPSAESTEDTDYGSLTSGTFSATSRNNR